MPRKLNREGNSKPIAMNLRVLMYLREMMALLFQIWMNSSLYYLSKIQPSMVVHVEGWVGRGVVRLHVGIFLRDDSAIALNFKSKREKNRMCF